MLDTLVPTFADGHIFLQVSRNTLLGWMPDDRVIQQENVSKQIGMSPYLLLPHAVMLHNEALVGRAEIVLKFVEEQIGRQYDPVLFIPFMEWSTEPWLRRAEEEDKGKVALLSVLNRHLEMAGHDLGHRQLPNVFNYKTERTLYEEGLKIRGSNDKLEAATQAFKETKEEVKELWKNRAEWGQVWLAMFVTTISISPVYTLSEAIATRWLNLCDSSGPIWASLLVMVCLAWAVRQFRGKPLLRNALAKNNISEIKQLFR